MRSRLLVAVIAIALAGAGLGLWNSTPTTEAQGPPGFELPPQAREVAPNAYFIGSTVVAGRVVDGYAYIHTRPTPQAAKPPWAGGGGGSTDASSCYSYTSGRRWQTPEAFTVYTDPVLTAPVVDAAVAAWEQPEADVAIKIFGDADSVGSGTPGDITSMDMLNEVAFGPISDPGVIAVTYTWAYRGPPSARQILEWDMLIDSDDTWKWGQAEGMDIASIVTHEVGHAAGMGHTDTSNLCQPATMYPYIDFADASKATLDDGDIAGIQALYR